MANPEALKTDFRKPLKFYDDARFAEAEAATDLFTLGVKKCNNRLMNVTSRLENILPPFCCKNTLRQWGKRQNLKLCSLYNVTEYSNSAAPLEISKLVLYNQEPIESNDKGACNCVLRNVDGEIQTWRPILF